MYQTTDNPIDNARMSLDGYIRHGSRYWPGANYFTLVGLDANGETTGAGADVCCECVSSVAADALDVMNGEVRVPSVGSDLGKAGYLGDGALAECGADPAYEIWGNGDSYTSGYGESGTCAECGAEIE